MTAHDSHTLGGAHALHALEPAEAALFETHLAACPSCVQEAAEFADTLARFAAADAVPLPDGMEARAMTAVTGIRQLPPARRTPDPRPPAPPEPGHEPAPSVPAPRRPRRRARELVLAACLALTATLGGVAVQQHDQAERARTAAAHQRTELQEVAALVTAPDARSSTTGSDEGSGTVVWSADRNQAAFLTTGLAPLPPDRVYELWYVDDEPRPAGLLPQSRGTVVLSGPLDGAKAVAVTAEPLGGSPAPTTDPLLVVRLA
ncbi:anti-sigma factor domain-containing protein [Kitasatospora sp. NPDC058406]|uniref:anti-sigma factor n=1 Tax=Kitasatospora sp. NPDC058406 TaxID=3346483 RepID=UPI00364C9BB9